MPHPRKLLMIVLCLSMILIACASDDTTTQSSLEGASNTQSEEDPTASEEDTVTTEPDANVEPAVVVANDIGLTGKLIYAQQENLYLVDFDQNGEQTLLTDNFLFYQEGFGPSPYTLIEWTPDGRLIYALEDYSAIEAIDLDTLETETVSTIPAEINAAPRYIWTVPIWSPDANWFFVFSRSTRTPDLLIAADGSNRMIEIDIEISRGYFWTEDNQLIGFNTGGVRNNVPQVESILIANTNDETVTDITSEIDIERLNNEPITLLEQHDLWPELLNDAGYTLIDNTINQALGSDFYLNSRRSYNTDSQYTVDLAEAPAEDQRYCFAWNIHPVSDSNELGDPVLNFSNVGYIDGLQYSEDNGFFFVQFVFDNCESSTPRGELVFVDESNTSTILADNLASTADDDTADGLLRNRYQRFVVGPDAQSVMWVASDRYGLETTFEAINLRTDATQILTINDEPITNATLLVWISGE